MGKDTQQKHKNRRFAIKKFKEIGRICKMILQKGFLVCVSIKFFLFLHRHSWNTVSPFKSCFSAQESS